MAKLISRHILIFKIIMAFALSSAIIFSLSSCFTLSTRNPSSQNQAVDIQELLKDRFTQNGYEDFSQRVFKSGALSREQMVQELAGRAIWFKSAPNERHHTYVFPQKVGVAIDWSQVFLTINHQTRFQTWGVINDPECCTPGVNCDQRKMLFNNRSVTMDDTFGWEYCAGDEALLNSVKNKTSYRDPACDDSVIQEADAQSNQIRESRCELKFGTSAGAVGFRKFPNPQFNADRWSQLGGYKAYSEQMIREGVNNSIQPPFRVALACASCHAGFDPLSPPIDLNNPLWSNIRGEAGNQYINISKLMASGMRPSNIETQLFTHTRPGTADTSDVAHDFINNPGTMNAIINFPQRPTFKETVLRWNQVDACTESDTCQKVAYKNENRAPIGFKFWQWQKAEIPVPHFLKGGEDSVGADLAIQRVYVNTGMCSEQCWANTLTNLREFDFTSRGFGEGVFDIGQCRQTCAAFRANEDRTPDILSYLNSRRPTDLKEALKVVRPVNGVPAVPVTMNAAYVDAKFNSFIEEKYGQGSLQQGQKIFATNCASCHSSQGSESSRGLDFLATTTLPSGEQIRLDWMGNDQPTSMKAVGTYACRALHSNHKRGNVWEQFSSESYKSRPSVAKDQFGRAIAGGPGYYRNISLLSVWATAPFLHNNAVGPELCGQTSAGREVVQTHSRCEAAYDPSVEGRLKLFDQSMDELLTPSSQRRKKVTVLDAPVKFPIGLQDMYIEFPAGMNLNTIANFDLKSFIYDFTSSFAILDMKGDAAFVDYWKTKFSDNPQGAVELGGAVKAFIGSLKAAASPNVGVLKVISKYYRTCDAGDDAENGGHDIATNLSASDKQALKAFLLTL